MAQKFCKKTSDFLKSDVAGENGNF